MCVLTLCMRVRHEFERHGTELRIARANQYGGLRTERLAHEPFAVLTRVAGEDEVIGVGPIDVGMAILIGIGFAITYGEPCGSATVLVYERHVHIGIKRKPHGLLHGLVLRDPEFQIALVIVELQLDIAHALAVPVSELGHHTVVRTVFHVRMLMIMIAMLVVMVSVMVVAMRVIMVPMFVAVATSNAHDECQGTEASQDKSHPAMKHRRPVGVLNHVQHFNLQASGACTPTFVSTSWPRRGISHINTNPRVGNPSTEAPPTGNGDIPRGVHSARQLHPSEREASCAESS